MIAAGWVALIAMIAGGLISMHMRWRKEMVICWVIAVLLIAWLFPAIVSA